MVVNVIGMAPERLAAEYDAITIYDPVSVSPEYVNSAQDDSVSIVISSVMVSVVVRLVPVSVVPVLVTPVLISVVVPVLLSPVDVCSSDPEASIGIAILPVSVVVPELVDPLPGDMSIGLSSPVDVDPLSPSRKRDHVLSITPDPMRLPVSVVPESVASITTTGTSAPLSYSTS